MRKLLVVINCPLNKSQGSGYIIHKYYIECLSKNELFSIKIVEPKDYMAFRFLGQFAISLRQAIGMFWFLLKEDKNNYDCIVFSGAESFLAVLYYKFLVKHKVPIIQHSNGVEMNSLTELKKHFGFYTLDGRKPRWYQFNLLKLYAQAFKYSDYIIVNSSFEFEFLVNKRTVNPEKIFILDNAVDAIFFNKLYENKKIKTIGFCGSWIKRKGVDVILSDLTLFLKAHKDFKFYIIGTGYGSNVRDLFPLDLVEQIIEVPYVSQKSDLALLYREIDIFISISVYESFGLSLVEAIASGCVAITSNTGFAYTLKHGVECYKIDKISDGKLLSALEYLITNEELKESIRYGGMQRVKALDWDTLFNRANSLYEQYLLQ